MTDPTQWELIAEYEAAQAVVDEIDEAEQEALIREWLAALNFAGRREVQTGAPTK